MRRSFLWSVLPQIAIKNAIIERLEEVFLLDIVALLDIGDRPRDAQNLIVRAGGQSEIVHRLF